MESNSVPKPFSVMDVVKSFVVFVVPVEALSPSCDFKIIASKSPFLGIKESLEASQSILVSPFDFSEIFVLRQADIISIESII